MALSTSPYFAPYHSTLQSLTSYSHWPGLDEYQQFLDANSTPVCNAQSQPLKVVPQDNSTTRFENRYAARIFLQGEMQTREQNWHDFFQVVTWRAFPLTKKAINARHYRAAEKRFRLEGPSGSRSSVENLLSLFDECGAIVVCDDESLLQLIQGFNWPVLFHDRRQELLTRMECILFGHAMLEKMFNPYIGVTANAILLLVDKDYFTQSPQQKLAQVDGLVAERIQPSKGVAGGSGGRILNGPKDLSPLPLLGFPGYWQGNELARFYRNTQYFRSGRRSP